MRSLHGHNCVQLCGGYRAYLQQKFAVGLGSVDSEERADARRAPLVGCRGVLWGDCNRYTEGGRAASNRDQGR